MKIIVTGAAGFIGSSLCEKLVADGHSVIGIDNFDPFYNKSIKLDNLKELLKSKNFKFFENDINDKELYLREDLKSADIIVHLAAKAGVRPSIDKPMDYLQANSNGTLQLLDHAVKNNIKRFVFASSSSVYGQNPNSPWKEDKTELMPISPYAASKIAAENLGKVYAHLYPMDFVALRFFTVYGPKQRPDLAIHKFFHKIYKGEEIELYGSGETYRDYTFIDDIIDGLSKAVYSPTIGKGFSCYNLGNCYEVSLAKLVQDIQDVTGIKAKIKHLPEQPGDVRLTCADISKSKSTLGYDPQTSIVEGLKKFNLWFKEQNGYK
jgi:UDP-glucuronate 4-epimerase